jgi:hypothetical protein
LNAGSLASGMYIYLIEATTLTGGENFVVAKKMLFLK